MPTFGSPGNSVKPQVFVHTHRIYEKPLLGHKMFSFSSLMFVHPADKYLALKPRCISLHQRRSQEMSKPNRTWFDKTESGSPESAEW